jgi:hypothetical protein
MFRPGGGVHSFDPEVSMTPAIGIGFLSLTGILIVAYVWFIVGQNRLQDELARHCKEEKPAAGIRTQH